jgi:hypothetical protein
MLNYLTNLLLDYWKTTSLAHRTGKLKEVTEQPGTIGGRFFSLNKR